MAESKGTKDLVATEVSPPTAPLGQEILFTIRKNEPLHFRKLSAYILSVSLAFSFQSCLLEFRKRVTFEMISVSVCVRMHGCLFTGLLLLHLVPGSPVPF